MNVTHLQTFVTIVDTGSLQRASVQMNVTQSTVTARLKALEAALGQTLLHRDKSGASLTPAGARVLSYARMISGLWRQARREVSLPKGLDALCTLAVEPDLWAGPGAHAADLLTGTQSGIALSLLRGSAAELDRWLSDGVIDLALTHRSTLRSGQTIHDLPPETLALYATTPEMPIVGSGQYVFVDYGPEFRQQHGESYFDAEVARIEFAAPTWALDHLLTKGGLAYLPENVAEADVSAGRLYELHDAPHYVRKRFLVSRDSATRRWPWFETFVQQLSNGPDR
ncbi:MAG: LysR family transcriptional regulator [Paracoccaceae bacterium]